MQKTFERQRLLNKMMAKPGPYPYVMILDHLKVDFNIGKIIRSADAFGAMGIDIVGTDFFDPMPAKGCMKNVPFTIVDTFVESYQKWHDEGYTFYAFDSEAELGIHEITFPEKSAFVMGNEGSGFSFRKEHYPKIKYLKIPQIGKVESLNVAVAASIVMYEFARSRNFKV